MIYFLLSLLIFSCFQGSWAQTTTTEPPPTPSPWFQCPGDGFFRNPYNCSEFFMCTNGLAWLQICSGGLHFNTGTGKCDWPQNVNCVPLSTASPLFKKIQVRDTNLGQVNHTCPGSGVFPHESQCELYYNCGPDITYLMRCDGGFLFDLMYNGCNFPEQVDCGNRTRPGESTTASQGTTGGGSFSCNGQNGFVPIYPGACSNDYYNCIGGNAYIQHCPSGTIFDPVELICKLPQDSASCLPTTMAPFRCPSDGFFPDPAKPCSNSYYSCTDGVATLMTCPGTSIFDPSVNICVLPENAACNGGTTVTSGPTDTTRTTTGPFVCPPQDGDYPNPNDCSQYYSCVNGVPYLQQCPPGTVFNPEASICDFPENVPGCEGKYKKPKYGRKWH